MPTVFSHTDHQSLVRFARRLRLVTEFGKTADGEQYAMLRSMWRPDSDPLFTIIQDGREYAALQEDRLIGKRVTMKGLLKALEA